MNNIFSFPLRRIVYKDITTMENAGEKIYGDIEEIIEDMMKNIMICEIYGRVIYETDEEIIVVTHGDCKGVDLTITYIPKHTIMKNVKLIEGD
ncbi:hypothetical protein DRN58_05795 [Thermococci archaeon]|nr:MAG: hypothetical protein DRN58_05795 [Thermococci archaeon]